MFGCIDELALNKSGLILWGEAWLRVKGSRLFLLFQFFELTVDRFQSEVDCFFK